MKHKKRVKYVLEKTLEVKCKITVNIYVQGVRAVKSGVKRWKELMVFYLNRCLNPE